MATVKYEKLVCQIGNHEWRRDFGIRGRKPVFCPKHKPATAVEKGSHSKSLSNGKVLLHCAIGNHNWEREPTRGRVPANCPAHKPALSIQAAPRNENGKVTLHCEAGNHDYERAPARGRKPTNCPNHSAPRAVPVSLVAGSETGEPVKRKPGRPKLYDSKEEQTEAQLIKSRERSLLLEGALKERGTHLSQQTPYILYKKIGEKAGRNGTPPTVTWEKVTEHSPLSQAQYINAHQKDFDSGSYRYERNGKVVIL